MKINDTFVTSEEGYRSLVRQSSEVFRAGVIGLPDQVFTKDFTHFRFLDFDFMLSVGFMKLLRSYAERYADGEIFLMLRDPDPDRYYFSHFRRYGVLRFSRTCTEDDYSNALWAEPEGSPADAIRVNARTAIWFGTSAKWGFWGERDLGIGVTATRADEAEWRPASGAKWFLVDEALTELVAINFRGRKIPGPFAERLREHFGSE